MFGARRAKGLGVRLVHESRHAFRQTVAAVTLLVGGSVQAGQADRPRVSVGDSWQFAVYYTVPSTAPNRTWVITAVGATDFSAPRTVSH